MGFKYDTVDDVFGSEMDVSSPLGGMSTSMMIDSDGGDDRYHDPHTQESATVALGMTGLYHPDQVVKRRR